MLLQCLLLFFSFHCLTLASCYEAPINNHATKPGDHPCFRECKAGSPMTCEYSFYVGWYYTMSKACFDCPFNVTDCDLPHCISADGYEKAVIVANKMLPGPDIQVCEGDTIEVTVHNGLEGGEATSIHWHGLHQKGTPWMDGVGMLTQCPIPGFTSFKYKFQAGNAGTHFWHSHSGLQRGDGLFGSLVVRTPPSLDPVSSYYDDDLPEHVVIVHDWLLELATNKFAGHHHDGKDNKPKSMLINGKGVYSKLTSASGQTAQTPRAVFDVTANRKYRFRMISNGILNCPLRVNVDQHKLLIIATDGNPITPYAVDSFIIFTGERFDFVLDANQAVGNYWLRVKGLADCSVKSAHQEAIVRYGGASLANPPGNLDWNGNQDGHQLNPWNTVADTDHVTITDMNATAPDDATSQATADKKFYVKMDFNRVDNLIFNDPRYYPLYQVRKGHRLYTPQLNHTSFKFPNAPPLTQWADVDKDLMCTEGHTQNTNCSEEYCACTYNLNVELGEVVEIVVVDEGVTYNANHPIHLHGHSFRVVGLKKLGDNTSLEEVMKLDREGHVDRKLSHAPLKDAVTVPDGGYTVIRFIANNPGVWLMHCHIDFHAEIGMALTISAGQPSSWPKPPPDFPRCGNYQTYPKTSQREVTMEECEALLQSTSGGNGVGPSVSFFVVLIALSFS